MRHLAVPAALLLLAPAAAAADPAAVRVAKTGTTVDFYAGPELVAKYQYAGTVKVEKGDGLKPIAKPVLWPLNAPGGALVTAFAPADHYHHKSVWFCHGDVIPEGIELKTKSGNKHVKGVDFWDEFPGYGRIVCTEVGEPKQLSANHVAVLTRNEWRTPDGVDILDESRTIHLIALPAGRLFVFDIDLHAATCPITFGDTKEGSFGTRVHPALPTQAKGGGTVTSSSSGKTVASPAKDNLSVWGEQADWHDYSGAVDGKPVGLAVFDDPKNPVRAGWHTRGYGLMAANPFGRAESGFPSQKGKTDLVKLAKGEHLKLRYGVYAHTGDAAAGQVAEAFRAFAAGK